MTSLIESRNWVSAIVAAGAGYLALSRWPFPAENALLQLILAQQPPVFCGIKYAYLTMCFTTPYLACSTLTSLVYIFIVRLERPLGLAKLPPYPDPTRRESLYLVLGEIHHPKRPEPAPEPQWLTIPERGLYTGIAVLGAIGSGKTSGCIYPFAEQILAYRAPEKDRPDRRARAGSQRRLLPQGPDHP
jgi:hypothetical protein